MSEATSPASEPDDSGVPGRAARVAAGLFALHGLLLFFPPIPPDVKGSLWSYLLGYAAVAAGLVAVHGSAGAIASGWARRARAGHRAGIVALAAAVLALGLALAEWTPELSRRFGREEGLWEPVTLFGYWGTGIVLLRRAGAVGEAGGKHLRLVGGAYVLLGLEEIDYFGIFGGVIGRVGGHYAGSLHDVVDLWANGLLPASFWWISGAGLLVAGGVLGLRGYLQPRRLAATVAHPTAAWAAGAVAVLGFAGAAEAGIFGAEAARTFPEEAVELAGAILLVAFGLEVAARGGGSDEGGGGEPVTPGRRGKGGSPPRPA